MIDAISFELGKVETEHIRSRVVYVLNQIEKNSPKAWRTISASKFPKNLTADQSRRSGGRGYGKIRIQTEENRRTRKNPRAFRWTTPSKTRSKRARSHFSSPTVLIQDDVKTMKDALEKEGAMAKIIGMKSSTVKDRGRQRDEC